MTVSNALVLAEEESDLTTANADITSWHVGVFTKVTVELGHEGLAESHDLSLDASWGSKSDPPFAPPIGMPVRAFLKICSKPRNLIVPKYTEGWNRNPPLYGPSTDEYSTRKPR